MRVRIVVFSLSLGLLVPGAALLQPSAFAQEASQETNARKLKTKVDPKYPELARQYQLSGKVKIEVTVSPDGSIKKTRVVGGNPLLAGAAIEAVKQWRFEAGSKETTEMVDFAFAYNTR